MEKKLLQQAYERIDVPKNDVLNAIKIGKERAVFEGSNKKRSFKRVGWSIVAAATVMITSSFISPSLSKVMAKVPLLGNVYVVFNDAVGRNLQTENLITELNEVYSQNGIDVSITNAYYDGAVVGVTFSVNGDIQKEEDGTVQGFYEVFDGSGGISDSKELVYMEPSQNQFVGHIRLNYPKTQLPSDTTFPLEFKRIGEIEGNWRFDVPIKQLPFETIEVDKESYDNQADVNVNFDSIVKGKASTAINYTTTLPVGGKKDQVRLEIYDDKSKQIEISSDGIDLETLESNDSFVVKNRSIIPESLKGRTSHLVIVPKVAIYAPNQFVNLKEKTPVTIKAARQDLAVMIERITTRQDRIIVDFQIQNKDTKDQNYSFYKNFAFNDVTLVKKSEKEIYQKSMKHSLEILNKEELRFRNTFDLSDAKNFKLNDYVLRINMNSLSMNNPVELNRVKVNLD
ncbi:DUF4179 domain-containing protein [Fictibacillus barbaricus]|uniref:DUF4179 domain-containing protein n=1 Tax=Fictibacillus barbaricus TaxID=182136 RepID=A0ABS2Z7B5_9BACL|nr:DUF4179 domain-containing protein [Fictibacillus barbaricus]MBN3543888.1 DUF4179 domain-containing protein [Fictibacillus barbaricus]GGB72268.1 hypothetical protein GCM10007199_43050 [Fictibacillus barbaricus]